MEDEFIVFDILINEITELSKERQNLLYQLAISSFILIEFPIKRENPRFVVYRTNASSLTIKVTPVVDVDSLVT